MLFHGRGRNGKRHPLALAPCGSIRASGENGQHSGAQPLSGALQRQKGEPFALSVKPFGFASSPKGRAKTVVGTLLASFLKGHQGHTGSASCLSLWERWMRPTGADGEGATAPLRGAAAAAAEGLSNRRSAKNAFSEAASIFPLRLLLWGLKGASSPWRRVAAPSIRFVPWAALASCWPLPQQLLPVSAAGGGRSCCIAGWVESRGREGGVEIPLPTSGPAERPAHFAASAALSPLQ